MKLASLVVSVVLILIGLFGIWLVRGVRQAREAIRRSVCVGHLKWAIADGSIRFVKQTIDPRLFKALATIAGGEDLPAEEIP